MRALESIPEHIRREVGRHLAVYIHHIHISSI
jgi:hypothetical protein